MNHTFKKLLAASLAAAALLLSACGAKETDGVTVPSGMQLIVSEANDYNLIVPDDWLVDTTVGMTSAYAEDAARSSVTVCANELTSSTTSVSAYFDSYKEEMAATFADFAMVDPEPSDVKIGDVDGYKYRYTATVGDVQYQWMQILFVRNATLYMLTYTSTADGYEEQLDDVNDIIANFSFR